MAFWKDFIKSELIDIVEWLDESGDTLVHRFERHENEIKNGAQLIVRPGQTAVFVDQGRIADVFQPGRYELKTENIPILSTLRGWKYGFDSPFKAEVYFVSTRQVTDQKWGTKNPIMLRDPEFGPVRLRAFGSYAFRVAEPAKLIVEIVGTNGTFTVDGVGDQLRNLIVARFADALAELKLPALDLAANYDELGDAVRQKIGPDFAGYGIEITTFLVENISLPEEVEKMLDKRSSMGVLGDLGAYTQFQTAQAIEAAAENPGGTAGAGMGMGMGFAMAQQMGQALGGQQGQPRGATPPPLPGQAQFFVAAGGAHTGPHALDALRQQAASGALTRDTLVWKEGMAAWTRAGEVAELAPVFGAVPPPLPPQ
ncbi:MAG TPA: SPFH domain-containing protein [Longimicrobiaceae bacterium]|nr:SPFH domain-containing protein [Longimicrobiaceae bacterium]